MAELLSLSDAFKLRRSVRGFDKEPLSAESMDIVARIVSEVNEMAVPFGMKTDVRIHGPGLGRGAIANETGWLTGGVIGKSEDKYAPAIMDLAFRLQIAVIG